MATSDDYAKGASDFAKGVRLREAIAPILDANSWTDDLKVSARFMGYFDAMNAKIKDSISKGK